VLERLFGPELIPTRDRLLALNQGGGDWPLNIVLACRSCNSSRCDLLFRTFCRMLSPAQNKQKRNLQVNKLLPKGMLGIQKAYIAVLRAEIKKRSA
jgi:hypothetical protein